MIVKLVHDNNLDLAKDFQSICNEFTVESEVYDMRYTTDKKKGFKVKGAFSARLDPFIGVYNSDNQPIKGFYSEAEECSIDNLYNYLNSLKR